MEDLWMSKISRYPLWKSDTSWRALIGVIYPTAGNHHIDDFYKLRPKGVYMGGTTVPRHKDESLEAMLNLDEHVVSAAKQLAASKPDVIAWICTAGSFLKGRGHDEKLVKEMEQATNIPCMTTSTAVRLALEQLKAKKICIATPYPLNVNDVEKKFFEDNGFKVVRCDGLDLVDNSIIGNISANVIYRLAKAVDVPEAEAMFISCTGLDVLDIIEPLEYDLGKPVITSNQASYWLAFKMARIGEPIQGYGQLMRERRL